MDFLNFDFSIGMARIGQLCRSRVARFAAFHSKDASLETAMRTNSCLIPYLPVSSLNTAIRECSDIGGSRGERVPRVVAKAVKKIRWSKRILLERGKCRCTENTRDCGIIDTFQTAGREFAIVQVDLIDTTIVEISKREWMNAVY